MFVVKESANEKVGLVSATYAPIDPTCSDACPLKVGGCYARTGNVGFQVRRLQREFDGLNGDTLAELEGSEIESVGLSLRREGITRALRIHVSGDADSNFRASALAWGAREWPGPVWSYTHSWRHVFRSSWGRVSVLASVETVDDASSALSNGYAPALIVDRHPDDGRAYRASNGLKLIPCPAQTRDIKCTDCRLCWDDSKLIAQRAAITFAAHGSGAKKVRLNVLQPTSKGT